MTIHSTRKPTILTTRRVQPQRSRLPLYLLALSGIVLAGGCGNKPSEAPPEDAQALRPIADASTPGDNGSSSWERGSATGPITNNRLSYSDSEATEAQSSLEPPTGTQGTQSTVLAGTAMVARLETTLDSSIVNVGDEVRGTVMSDVRDSKGQVAIPSGTVLTGHVTDVQAARKVHKMASLAFTFDRATLQDGSTVAISAGQGFDGKGWTKKQGAIIGGSAAGGAILGQVLGKDTNSTVGGAIVGGAIATGIIMSNKGEDVVLSSGSTMDLTLDSDVTVRASAS